MSEPATERSLDFGRRTAIQVDAPSWQREGSGARPLVFRVVDGNGDAAETTANAGGGAGPREPDANAQHDAVEERTPNTNDIPVGAEAQGQQRPSARPPAQEPAAYSQPPAMAAAPVGSAPAEGYASREGELTLMLEQRIEAFAEAALELGAARVRAIAAAEGQLLDLAMALASAIVEREVQADPELHGALAVAALETLGDTEHARLRVSPAAYDAMRETFDDDSVDFEGVRVEFESDPRIAGLGCIADSPRARVDGRVAERLRAARRAVEDARRQTQEGEE